VKYTSGNSPREPIVADFNNDGIPDIATDNVVSSNISVFLGKGDGTFKPAQNFPVLGTAPKSVAAGDLNGDGKLDLVACNDNSGNVSVLLGNGDGTFQTAVLYPASSGPRDIALASLRGNGILDIVVVNGNAGRVVPIAQLAKEMRSANQQNIPLRKSRPVTR
jgi:hypothetical protein